MLAKLSLRLSARESLSTESVNDCSAIVDAAKRHAFCKAEPSLLCMACTSLLRCGTSPQRSRKHILYVSLCQFARDYIYQARQHHIFIRTLTIGPHKYMLSSCVLCTVASVSILPRRNEYKSTPLNN